MSLWRATHHLPAGAAGGGFALRHRAADREQQLQVVLQQLRIHRAGAHQDTALSRVMARSGPMLDAVRHRRSRR